MVYFVYILYSIYIFFKKFFLFSKKNKEKKLKKFDDRFFFHEVFFAFLCIKYTYLKSKYTTKNEAYFFDKASKKIYSHLFYGYKESLKKNSVKDGNSKKKI